MRPWTCSCFQFKVSPHFIYMTVGLTVSTFSTLYPRCVVFAVSPSYFVSPWAVLKPKTPSSTSQGLAPRANENELADRLLLFIEFSNLPYINHVGSLSKLRQQPTVKIIVVLFFRRIRSLLFPPGLINSSYGYLSDGIARSPGLGWRQVR